MIGLVVVVVVASLTAATQGYSSGIPPVNRRALAGLWKLTPSILSMKEFTVHPRKPPKQQEDDDEVLLMLKEDGSFSRYELHEPSTSTSTTTTTTTSKKKDVDRSWKQFRSSEGSDPTKTLFKGTWDYRDGELILAADRDEQKAHSDAPPQKQQQQQQQQQQPHLFSKKGKDTILVGVVVATRQEAQKNLVVPMGSVQVGKFFYPKNHPSFFDQPIFQPKRFGTFQLKQVLGNHNLQAEAEQHAKDNVEKFRNKDFHNKKFFLTSSPIESRRPKGHVRWSIKYNKYVEDPPSQQAQKAAEADKNRLVSSIRVMKLQIHANNTFSTLAGLGDSTVLRGRFHVMGEKRDHVWMQSLRFGFGRSVSGSTYSEGNALGEETKSYWGKISYQGEDENEDEQPVTGSDDKPMATTTNCTTTTDQDDKPKRLQVRGTVLVGWGLEPQPVASFIMREADDDDLLDTDEDDEDEEEEEVEDDNEPKPPAKDDDKGDDLWTSTDAFQ